MKDLYRCLDECHPSVLGVVASSWGVTLPQPQGQAAVRRVADAMLAPGALEAVLSQLSPRGRDALQDLVQEGGTQPGRRLALAHGQVRRLGPARLAREQPGQRPSSTLEELFYKGLVFRAYASVEGHYGEVFVVPQQLLERMRSLFASPSTFVIETVPAPPCIRSQGTALAEDLFSALVYMRTGRITWQDLGDPTSSTEGRPTAGLAAVLSARLAGDDDSERWALTRRLLRRLHLVMWAHGVLRPSLRARDWLRLSDMQRQQRLLWTWRDDPAWDELPFVAGIRVEGRPVDHQMHLVRGRFLELLSRAPRQTWLSLDSLVADVRRHRPDYLRPDGDASHWFVRDAQGAAYLTGEQSWDQVEGALARHLLVRSLWWLGVIDVGTNAERHPVAVQVTGPGGALLDGLGFRERPARMPVATQVALCGEHVRIQIQRNSPMYARYLVERFADWVEQGDAVLYDLTAESLWRALNAGIRVEGVLRFLRRLTANHLGLDVTQTVEAWGRSYGRVVLRSAVVLQTADDDTMQHLSSLAEVRQLLGPQITTVMRIVDEAKVEELTTRLKSLGIWPRVRL